MATKKTQLSKSKAAVRKMANKVAVPAKKKTVAQILATIKRKTTVAAKKTAKQLVVAQPIKLNTEHEQLMAEWKEREDDKASFIGIWAKKLSATRRRMLHIQQQYKKFLYQYLQEAYEVYDSVLRSEYSEDFFASVRSVLYESGIKTQSNTTDAALIIRFVFGAELPTKTVHDYARALEGGWGDSVDAGNFAEWLERKTLTRVIEEQRAIKKEIETPTERLDRARRVVLRMLEIRETMPMIKFTRIEYDAKRMIGSRFGLCVMLGYAYRTFGRGSDSMNVDINLNYLLPPSLDLEITIVDKLARHLIGRVEHYEQELDVNEEGVWANDVWERLVAACDAEVEKNKEYWANRQQAALAEDQYEFARVIKQRKKN